MESLFWCFLAFLGLTATILGCVVVASILGLSTGLVGLAARNRALNKDKTFLTWLLVGLVIVCTAILATIGYSALRVNQFIRLVATQSIIAEMSSAPRYFNADNEEMLPFIAALNAIDRTSLGFTLVPANARVEIEHTVPPATYDVMLHIYADTSRTIAFKRKDDGSYVWVGEQEIHTGPNKYLSADGYFNEEVTITYDTVYLSGAPLNRVYITYRGDNAQLQWRDDITLEEIQPILEEWKNTKLTPTPSSE
jgi:hypothetical protein